MVFERTGHSSCWGTFCRALNSASNGVWHKAWMWIDREKRCVKKHDPKIQFILLDRDHAWRGSFNIRSNKYSTHRGSLLWLVGAQKPTAEWGGEIVEVEMLPTIFGANTIKRPTHTWNACQCPSLPEKPRSPRRLSQQKHLRIPRARSLDPVHRCPTWNSRSARDELKLAWNKLSRVSQGWIGALECDIRAIEGKLMRMHLRTDSRGSHHTVSVFLRRCIKAKSNEGTTTFEAGNAKDEISWMRESQDSETTWERDAG
jgi:hypothetical protein